METFPTEDGVVVRIDTGEQVLESIREACADHDVHTGAVITAIGTLRNLHVHYLHTSDLDEPERNTFLEFDGAWEVSGVQGMIADGEPHLHVTAYDGERTIAGHLEDGNEVNALFEVYVKRIDELRLTRAPNEDDVSVLVEE